MIALSKPQQREAGLRFAPVPARVAVRGLGGFEVALQAMELPLLVERLPCCRAVHRLLAALARELRLRERVAPLAVELHDSRAMCEAAAAEGDQLRLLLAPTGQGVGPLVGATRIVRRFTARDHSAVHDAGEDRRDFAGGDSHHRLVQQP